jgi:hypothetical protein
MDFRNRETRRSGNRTYPRRGKTPIPFGKALLLPAGSAELHRKYGGTHRKSRERSCGTSGGPGEIGAVLLSAFILLEKSARPGSLLTLIARTNINSFLCRRTKAGFVVSVHGETRFDRSLPSLDGGRFDRSKQQLGFSFARNENPRSRLRRLKKNLASAVLEVLEKHDWAIASIERSLRYE